MDTIELEVSTRWITAIVSVEELQPFRTPGRL